MEEIWMPIKGYEGLYEISNYGKVRSLGHKVWNGKGFYIREGKTLKPLEISYGYLAVQLKRKTIKIHQLFILKIKSTI